MIDQRNRAYRYDGKGHLQVPVAVAIDRVFEGLEEMGWTRETRYDEEFVAEKHRKLRAAGYTVVTTAAPGSGEMLNALEGWDDTESHVSDEL
jgi:hypothetical protein